MYGKVHSQCECTIVIDCCVFDGVWMSLTHNMTDLHWSCSDISQPIQTDALLH